MTSFFSPFKKSLEFSEVKTRGKGGLNFMLWLERTQPRPFRCCSPGDKKVPGRVKRAPCFGVKFSVEFDEMWGGAEAKLVLDWLLWGHLCSQAKLGVDFDKVLSDMDWRSLTFELGWNGDGGTTYLRNGALPVRVGRRRLDAGSIFSLPKNKTNIWVLFYGNID